MFSIPECRVIETGWDKGNWTVVLEKIRDERFRGVGYERKSSQVRVGLMNNRRNGSDGDSNSGRGDGDIVKDGIDGTSIEDRSVLARENPGNLNLQSNVASNASSHQSDQAVVTNQHAEFEDLNPILVGPTSKLPVMITRTLT